MYSKSDVTACRHPIALFLQDTLPITAAEFFDYLYSDESDFTEKFRVETRKDTNLQVRGRELEHLLSLVMLFLRFRVLEHGQSSLSECSEGCGTAGLHGSVL